MLPSPSEAGVQHVRSASSPLALESMLNTTTSRNYHSGDFTDDADAGAPQHLLLK